MSCHKNVSVRERTETEFANSNVECPARRVAMKACSCAFLSLATGQRVWAGVEATAHPETGDLLVRADAVGTPAPLGLGDITVNAKPIVAFPFDPTSGTVKNGSRLNTVVLIRMAPERIDDDMRSFSAGGVLAFSGICTHQGCAITEYVAKDDAFVCFCHFSQFRPTSGGEVVAGPAPRSLPKLPLRLDGQSLVVAGKFSAKPGVTS